MKTKFYTSVIVLLVTLFTTQNAEARIFPSSVNSAVRENNRVLVKGRDITRNDIVQIEITNPENELVTLDLKIISRRKNRVIFLAPSVEIDTKMILKIGEQRFNFVVFDDDTSLAGVDPLSNDNVVIESGFGTVVGSNGKDGSSGDNGDDGQQGEAGPEGPAGPRGLQGAPGARGLTGATGPAGTFTAGGTITDAVLTGNTQIASTKLDFTSADSEIHVPGNLHFTTANTPAGSSHVTFGETTSGTGVSVDLDTKEGIFKFGKDASTITGDATVNVRGTDWKTAELIADITDQGAGLVFDAEEDYAILSTGATPPAGLNQGELSFVKLDAAGLISSQRMALLKDGGVEISDFLRLKPMATAPAAALPGTVYFDTSDALCIRTSTNWVNITGVGTCN